MDKENGKANDSSSGPNKVSNVQDPAALLNAASLFGAYWPRAGDANAANLFAAAGGFGMPPSHGASMPFGMLPPTSSATSTSTTGGSQSGGGGRSSRNSGGASSSSHTASSTSGAAAAAAAAAAYSNAYNNTLSMAASQAASLGMPAASAAWWQMASHIAAQDYLAKLQASGLNFSMGSPAEMQYAAALGLPYMGGAHHKSDKNSSKSRTNSGGGSRDKYSSLSKMDMHNYKANSSIPHSKSSSSSSSSNNTLKYSSPSGLTIQPSVKLPGSGATSANGGERLRKSSGSSDMSYLGKLENKQKNSASTSSVKPSPPSPSIFTNPMSMASNSSDKCTISTSNTANQNAINSSIAGLPSSILSDPNSILGGVRLPPDTEIIKYTSSIVGPKIPGTTNRGRKKTISLDPPSVSVLLPSHSSTGLLIERTSSKRQKLNDLDLSPPTTPTSDRVEVIKLPATNGSPSGISVYSSFDSGGDAPLNLSLKPGTSTNHSSSSSLNQLSNMSASIGMDRISRRKPGPKPRRVVSTDPTGGAAMNQMYLAEELQRPSSRNEGSDGGSSTSSTSLPPALPSSTMIGSTSTLSITTSSGHKEGRPRNLGRGVSKPKKNTVASLLAQSRALGIKPVPMLDPNASMNQQMNLLKSNILAAQQYIQEAGGDEKALNKFLQERFKGSVSDSSTVDASDSDNLTDSNHTDSEMESDVTAKRQKVYDERLLRVPLERGWRRETIIRGLTKNGGLKGDVTYSAPDSSNKFKQMSDVTQYLEYQKSAELTKDNFTFSCRVVIGDYLQPIPPEMQTDGNEYIHLTEEEVAKRLEELKATMRTSLPVEQRIEMARKQQAARAAARIDREHQRLNKEIERNERQEAARREKEARNHQLLEDKRKRQQEIEKQKQEEHQRKQQERELKRQQAAIMKEQIYIQEINKQREMLYTVELEKERRRQHLALIKSMENRRKLEEKERKKQQLLAEKQANKEKKLEQRKTELEILTELRKPCEDLELDQKPLPKYERIPNIKLCGKAFADTLMIFEFLHNFGETLGFDMESLPTLDSLQQALLPNEHSFEAEEELFSVMTHLLVCAIEDPGIPNPARHTTILGQSLRAADITHANLSEILRIYLYANATGEIKSLCGAHFERDREKRIADHHQTEEEMQQSAAYGKNAQYYERLHENSTYKMSQLLREKPFIALSPTDKAAIIAFICNELLQNKAVVKQIESSLERGAHLKKDKWLLDSKIRKVKLAHNRKCKEEKAEAKEKSLNKSDLDDSTFDSSSLHKDDLLDDDENEMSENESVAESCGTQPDEDEDNKLSAEELGKKLEKLLKTSETQMQALSTSLLQLRATTFGEDRHFRRYWSMPKAGGIFVEAMESAEPEELENQLILDQHESVRNGIRSLNELNNVIEKVETMNDTSIDNEVSNILGNNPNNKENLRDSKRSTNENENEHRKTPNRLSAIENGDLDTHEHNLAELQKSVDDMVQSLGQTIGEHKLKETQNDSIKEEPLDVRKCQDESIASKKFNLFEKLGQCMERENKSEYDLKADVKAEIKEELKNEILKELKTEIKSEVKVETSLDDGENKWFSILYKDGSSCEEIHLTTGNKWENGNVGACTKDITELKIPVFPPPGSSSNSHHNCDSPPPLQMTAEESTQMEHIKKHGMPAAAIKKSIATEERYGWWRISDPEQMREVLDNFHVRGVREKELKRTFIYWMQFMHRGQLVIDKGHPELIELTGENIDNVVYADKHAPVPDEPGSWNQSIAHRVDLNLLEQVEALEDKVANASMQVKGWKVPNRNNPEYPMGKVFFIVRDRITLLEQNIERRYLKPPLGINTNVRTSTGGESTATTTPTPSQETPASPTMVPSQPVPGPDEIPKGLSTWREAVHRASTTAQLAMCLYSLESSIAWDKSIMKANCQFCSSGDNEDKLLLCDSCDRGYHTYCFKPKIDTIPEGDWYCHECMNKATGERNCVVCGKKASLTGTRLLSCEFCPRAYHTDCIRPQIFKAPRGKWYCSNCISRKPQRRPAVKKNHANKPTRDSESSDQPPSSPAMSHSSVTTNEDMPPTNCSLQSDASNSSLIANDVIVNAQLQQQQAQLQQQQAQAKKEQKEKEKAQKKALKELGQCQSILEDLECHDDAWPFLLPVNTKQFPTYKKIIKVPMDLSTIRKRLQDMIYKSKEDFSNDVRQIFNNCETFNEDDSPVGKAGHCMRQFFEAKWNEHFCSSNS